MYFPNNLTRSPIKKDVLYSIIHPANIQYLLGVNELLYPYLSNYFLKNPPNISLCGHFSPFLNFCLYNQVLHSAVNHQN